MTLRIIVYEDKGWHNLLPLTYPRAVFQLICGCGSLLERIRRLASKQAENSAGVRFDGNGHDRVPEVWCRPILADVVSEQTGLTVNEHSSGKALFLNGRGLWNSLPDIDPRDSAWVGIAGPERQIVCVWADSELLSRLSPETFLYDGREQAVIASLPQHDVSQHVRLFDWPWELIHHNAQALLDDWELTGSESQMNGTVYDGAYLLNHNSIRIGSGTRVKPCVVIDAENGPVWIGKDVTIMPHSYVRGPAYIGNGSLLQPGSVVHEGTTIGPRCKVGGEIEASIFLGFSNKQHDGFLGHSYIGSWVNIAADCINSDLKNTYGTVRVPINGRSVDSGAMFVGMLMGDHSKAGINVSFPTGAVVGFCSSVFAPRSPKFVPSFSWINGDHVTRYDEERGLGRDRVLSEADERVFRSVRQQALALEHPLESDRTQNTFSYANEARLSVP